MRKTTRSSYHPQTNAQVEVCNKTVAEYLKTQEAANTLNWELYMAPMAFAYNTPFHRTIKTTPFKLKFGQYSRTVISMAKQSIMAKTKVLNYFKQCKGHDDIHQIAKEHTEKAISRNISDHNKNAFPRKFKIGIMVVLEVKDF